MDQATLEPVIDDAFEQRGAIGVEAGGPVRAATRKRHETQANDAQKTRALNGD